jgi:hypothetical protein
MKAKLTRHQHHKLGADLKMVRRLLLDSALRTKCYPTISRQLSDLARELTMPRSYLQSRLIAEGASQDESREFYFGEMADKEAAE